MTLDELMRKCKDNTLEEYISILKPYSLYENTEKKFYICKRNIVGRIFKKFKYKYEVFENIDIEYGKINQYKMFINLNDAIEYLWSIIAQYYNL